MKHIGEIIHYYRIRAGISQKKLAGDFCSPKYVYLIEKGFRVPSTQFLKYFSDKLGADLLGIIPFLDSEDPVASYKKKENEANFKAFFNAIDDIYIVGNLRGNIIYANPATSSKLGYTEDELIKMQVIELNSTLHRAEAEKIFSDMILGKRITCPIPLQKKNGTLLPVETRVWFGTWNNEPCIFGVSKDLSSQQAAYDRFYKLFDNNPALMAISSLADQTIIEVNSTYLEKLGYTREEVIGKTSKDLNLFEDDELHQKAAKHLLETGTIKNTELTIVNKNGQRMHGVFSGAIIDNQLEKSYITVMMDISDLKAAQLESEIQRTRATELGAELHNIIEKTDDIFFSTDHNFKIITYNSSAQNHFRCCCDIDIKMGVSLADIPNSNYAASLIKLLHKAHEVGKIRVKYYLKKENIMISAIIMSVAKDLRKTLFIGKTMKAETNAAEKSLFVRDNDNFCYIIQKNRDEELYEANHDFLTNVLNRRAFIIRLQEHLNNTDNKERYLGLIMIDIDYFKQINDTYGHASGDIILKLFADCLKDNLRPEDILGRFGGDEFIVCLPDTNLNDVLEIAERLRYKISQLHVSFINSEITASLGVAIYTFGFGEKIDSLISRADKNMYKAKVNRNSIYLF